MKRYLIFAVLVTALVSLCGCAGTPAKDPNRTVDVKVVDQIKQSIQGASFEDFQLITTYDYDDSGRLASSYQSTNYPGSTINLCKSSFSYDDQSRVTLVENAYEQYDWHVGNTESFSYDEQGNCKTYTFEITSQGIGKSVVEYTYSDGGVVSSASETDYMGNKVLNDGAFSLGWNYLKNGHIEKVTSSAASANGFGLATELTDENNGIYSYRDAFGFTTTLRFDSEGNLASIERASSTSGREQTVFTYKTIRVKASDYKPSIFSNPQGFSSKFVPSLSQAETSRILG